MIALNCLSPLMITIHPLLFDFISWRKKVTHSISHSINLHILTWQTNFIILPFVQAGFLPPNSSHSPIMSKVEKPNDRNSWRKVKKRIKKDPTEGRMVSSESIEKCLVVDNHICNIFIFPSFSLFSTVYRDDPFFECSFGQPHLNYLPGTIVRDALTSLLSLKLSFLSIQFLLLPKKLQILEKSGHLSPLSSRMSSSFIPLSHNPFRIPFPTIHFFHIFNHFSFSCFFPTAF
jgi:hypothetical protein